MPTKPMRACTVPGCPNPATMRGKCALHAAQTRAQQEANRPSAAQRGYDAHWRVIRAMFLKKHPICACGKPATEVDHIKPLAMGGGNEWANLQALCKPCHSAKTMRQSVSNRR